MHNSIKLVILFFSIILFYFHGCDQSQKAEDVKENKEVVDWGRSRLLSYVQKELGADSTQISRLKVDIKTVGEKLPPGARKKEGYYIRIEDGKITIKGFDSAGALYGCLAVERVLEEQGTIPEFYEESDAPVMNLRGVCILLMKLGSYNYAINQKNFGFFYQKELWLEYLDFLVENRYNYIAFWNGHPFDYFVKLDKYPEAQAGMEPGLLEKNHEMLLWLCKEGAKRNIRFLFEFYNIHTSVYYQKAHALPDGISKPTPELEEYTAYCIEKFVKEFPQVGLYITPGEAISLEYADSWINQVIFPAVKRTGNRPPIFVRSWWFDLDRASRIVPNYADLYFERKYNVEMIADTLIDPQNKSWAELNGNLVTNIHMAANLEPFRWNPPQYIQKIMKSSVNAGSNGFHLYPRKSWRWPYGSDLQGSQLQWERDALWFQAWARYAWNPNYGRESEFRYWTDRLIDKFGNIEAANKILASFETGADVLPSLQRLLWLGHDNHTVVSAGAKLLQMEDARGIPFLPLKDCMRIPAYLESIRQKKTPEGKSPVDFLAEKIAEAEYALNLIQRGVQKSEKNKLEASLYEKDALATVLVVKFYYFKLKALVARTYYENNIEIERNKKAFIMNLQSSVEVFRELTELTESVYESLSDVPAKHPEKLEKCPYHWSDILPLFERELEFYKEDIKIELDSSYFLPTRPGLAGIWYSDPDLLSPDKSFPTQSLLFDWSGQAEKIGRNWSARWFGYLVSPVSGVVTLKVESDRGVILKIDNEIRLEWSDSEGEKDFQLQVEIDEPIPLEIIYNHAGGEHGYLKIYWQLPDGDLREIEPDRLSHTPAQNLQTERIAILNKL